VAEAPRVIRGTVRDSAGNAVSGARVFFVDGPVPLPDIAALSDATGRFTLTAPVDGTYRIRCAVDDRPAVDLDVAVESDQQQNVDIQLWL
jgi:hypothetical protein